MILKTMIVDSSGRNWACYEADAISYRKTSINALPIDTLLNTAVCEDISTITDDTITLFTIRNTETDKTHYVASNNVSWLLNNNGKTIDRVN